MKGFVPHAIIICENRIPSPIFVAAMLGVEKLLRIDFPETVNADYYVQFALEAMHARIQQYGGSTIPAFGKPVAIVVNFSEKSATRYDLNGRAVEQLSAVQTLGQASISL
jgi:hypothetical protein